MFKCIIFVLCITSIYCANKKNDSKQKNGSSYSGGDNQPLVVVLQNGKEYTFDNAHVIKSVDNGSNFVLELDDGSMLNVTSDNVDVKPSPNSSMEVNNVKDAKNENGNLVLDLENGDQMVVKNPESYEDKGDGTYEIQTGENTEMNTEKNNASAADNDEEEEEDDDVSSSSASSYLGITSVVAFLSVYFVM